MNISYKINHLNKFWIFLVITFFIILRFALVFSQQSNLAGIEQNVIYGIQLLLNGDDLYRTPQLAPFSIIQYTPLYYFICAVTAKIFGFGAMNIQELYVIGRLWNIIFNLLTAFFVCKICQNILKVPTHKNKLIFLLSFCFIYIQNFAVRPDSLHDLLGIISIYYFLIYFIKTEKSLLILFLSIFATAIAMLSKQSGIQFIILFLGFTIWKLDWKAFIKVVLLAILIYGTMLSICNYVYPSFYENTVGGITNGINLEDYYKNIVFRLLSIISIWPFIILCVFFLIRNKALTSKNVSIQFIAICMLGTLIFAGVTALKMGSTIQYFTVFLNLALIFIFKSFEEIEQQGIGNKNLNLLNKLFYCYLILLIFVFSAYNIKYIRYFNYNTTLNNQRLSAIKTANYIINDDAYNKQYIFANLTSDVSIASRQALNNIFYKNCLMPQMDILEYSTKTSKVIGYKKFEEMLNDGKIGYIIESKPLLNFSILKNFNQIKDKKFKLIKNIDGYLIYKFSMNDESN